jgi:hypothetical protein
LTAGQPDAEDRKSTLADGAGHELHRKHLADFAPLRSPLAASTKLGRWQRKGVNFNRAIANMLVFG